MLQHQHRRIVPHRRAHRSEGGLMLIFSLSVTLFMLAMGSVGVMRAMSDVSLASRYADTANTFYALEGALDRAVIDMRRQGVDPNVPGSIDYDAVPVNQTVTLPSSLLPAGIAVTATPLDSGLTATWQLTAHATPTPAQHISEHRDLQVILTRTITPMDGLGIFADQALTLEDIDLDGPAGSNGPIILDQSDIHGNVISTATEQTYADYHYPGSTTTSAFANIALSREVDVYGDIKTNAVGIASTNPKKVAIYLGVNNRVREETDPDYPGFGSGGKGYFGPGGALASSVMGHGVMGNTSQFQGPVAALPAAMSRIASAPPVRSSNPAVRAALAGPPVSGCTTTLSVGTNTTLTAGQTYCNVTVAADKTLTIPSNVTIQGTLSAGDEAQINVTGEQVLVGVLELPGDEATFTASRQVGIRELTVSGRDTAVSLPGGKDYRMERVKLHENGANWETTVTFTGPASTGTTNLYVTDTTTGMVWLGETTIKTSNSATTLGKDLWIYLVDGAPFNGWEDGGVNIPGHRIFGSVYGPESTVRLGYFNIDGKIGARTLTMRGTGVGGTEGHGNNVRVFGGQSNNEGTFPTEITRIAWRQM